MTIQLTKNELFMRQAPALNFEYDEDELLQLALDRGFVKPVKGEQDLYEVNENY